MGRGGSRPLPKDQFCAVHQDARRHGRLHDLFVCVDQGFMDHAADKQFFPACHPVTIGIRKRTRRAHSGQLFLIEEAQAP